MYNLLTGDGNNLPTLIIFGVLLVGIIGLFIWQSISGKKKQQEAQNMVNALKVGDRVKTIGGICGFVVEINNNENTFVLETGTDDKKSYVKFDKGAIYQTAPAEGAANAKKEIVNEEPVEQTAPKAEQAPQEKSAKKAKAKKVETSEKVEEAADKAE